MATPDRRLARALGVAFIALLLFGVFETVGAVWLRVVAERQPRLFRFDLDRYVDSIPEARLEAQARAAEEGALYAPDPELGWIRRPGSRFTWPDGTTMTTDDRGSRVVPGARGPERVATYGDSFTEGLEVDDGETWQAHWSERAGISVLNFGVSGYGPDQALLYLERNLARGLRTPVVVLAMIEENANRILNTARIFYSYPATRIQLGFKPMFEPGPDGAFRLVNFLPSDLSDREAIRRALHAAAEHDRFARDRTERNGFPFSWNAARLLARRGPSPRQSWPAYSDEAMDRLGFLLERFHADGRSHGFTPVFVLLPANPRQLQAWRGARARIRALAERPALEGLVYVDAIGALGGEDGGAPSGFDPARYLKVTHPSDHGTRAIAAVLDAAVGERLRATRSDGAAGG